MKHAVCLFCLFPLAAVLVTSCSGQSLKPGESDYGGAGGTLTAVEPASYEEVIQATNAAMKGLDLKPDIRERDGFRTFIVGETIMGQVSQSHEIRVWISRLTDRTTQIEMRILGRRDEQRLQAIHQEIRQRLGLPAAPAATK